MMKAITLHQPWATLIARGEKAIETRSWPTSWRGQLAIHAGLRLTEHGRRLLDEEVFATALGHIAASDLPLGAVVAVAEIGKCWRFTEKTADQVSRASLAGLLPRYEEFFGDYTPGRYGIRLARVKALAEPVPARGLQSIWTLPADVEARIRDLLTGAPVIETATAVVRS